MGSVSQTVARTTCDLSPPVHNSPSVRMSVYRGQVVSPHNLTLVTLGDAGVGKTSLINRFCSDNFNENHVRTSFCRYVHETVIGSRRVRYTIWDTSGSLETNTTRSLAYREADVFLLCYNISSPSSLFSAINHWVPDLRLQAPSTPIVLVGCQSDLCQFVTEVVSSPQALSMSQQIGAVMHVETTAKSSRRGVASVMEVAALTLLGQFSPLASLVKTPLPPSPPVSKKHRQRSLSISRDWEGSLRSNSSTISSTRSDVSMTSLASKSSAASKTSKPASPKVSINTCRTPKTERKQNRERDKEEREQEKMVMIKCQRLKADKTYEEVEIQVLAAVYHTMMIHSDPQTGHPPQKQQLALHEKKGLTLGLT